MELKKQLPSEPEPTDPTIYTIRLRTPEETFLRDRLFRAREDVRLLSIYAAVNGYDEDRYGLWAYGTGEVGSMVVGHLDLGKYPDCYFSINRSS